MPTVEYNTAVRLFEQIQQSFSDLTMNINREPENVDLEMDIPKQTGMAFAVNLNLQTDELHLSTQDIWCSWFPVKDEGITDNYLQAVIGLIKGDYRIVNLTRKGKVYRSLLQKPNGTGWETISTYHKKLKLPWLKFTKVEIKNRAAQQNLNLNRIATRLS